MAIGPSEDDIVYHLMESIEPWRDPDDGSYWHASRVVEDSSFEFEITNEDDEVIKTFTITVREN